VRQKENRIQICNVPPSLYILLSYQVIEESQSKTESIWKWRTIRKMKQSNSFMLVFGGIKLLCSSICSQGSGKTSIHVGKMDGPHFTMRVARARKTLSKFLLCGKHTTFQLSHLSPTPVNGWIYHAWFRGANLNCVTGQSMSTPLHLAAKRYCSFWQKARTFKRAKRSTSVWWVYDV
jgi:hypothetical protein